MTGTIFQGNMSEIICYFVNNILQTLKYILVYLLQHVVMKCDPKDKTWKL